MTRQQLRVLIIDDNNNGSMPQVTESLRSWLTALMSDSVVVDNTTNVQDAIDLLGEQTYDLALIDINLGTDAEYGGIDVLVTAWQAMRQHGTHPILYSADPAKQAAYKAFERSGGPFQFVLKAGFSNSLSHNKHCDALLVPVVEALRQRSRSLCQGAEYSSAVAVREQNAAGVLIDRQPWSVDSLLAPWLCQLEGEERREREALIRFLFPGDDLIRVFSYWFKGQAYSWPQAQMYGLTPLAKYHLSSDSGSMDALMHVQTQPPLRFSEAGAAAIHDLNSLGASNLCDATKEHLQQYISGARAWTQWTRNEMNTAEQFKRTAMFRPEELIEIFRQANATVDMDRIKCWKNSHGQVVYGGWQFYCPPYSIRGGAYEPAVKYAMRRLATSQGSPDRAGGAWRVILDSDGDLLSGKPQFPYLLLIICLSGRPSDFRSFGDWIQHGHDLWAVKESLNGCAQWFVFVGDKGEMRNHDAFLGTRLSGTEAENLWKQYTNCEKQWHVMHVLKFGMPVFA